MDGSKSTLGLFIFIFLSLSSVKAADMIVYGHRFTPPRGMFYSQVHTFERDYIEKFHSTDINDIIKHIPGLSTQRSGGFGHNSTYRIRGSETGQVLVLVDGMAINDPITTSGLFSGDFLSMHNIERIEVIKGPQSLAYGPRALAGIISITTRDGRELAKKQRAHDVSLEWGNHHYRSGAITTRGHGQRQHHAIAVERRQTDGFNITSQTSKSSPSKEGAEATHGHTHYGRQIGPIDLKTSVHFNRGEADLDKGFGQERDIDNALTRKTNYHGILSLHSNELFSMDELSLNIHHGNNRSHTEDLKDELTPDDQFFRYRSQITNIHLSAQKRLHPKLELSLAGEWLHHSGDFEEILSPQQIEKISPASIKTWGMASAATIHHNNLSLHLGGRYENHSLYDDQFLYSIMPVLMIPDWQAQINFQYSTGENAPSLYQLYSRLGNTELSPEKTTSYELNFEKAFQGLNLGISFFIQENNHLINTNADFTQYINTNELQTYGGEFSANYQRGANFYTLNITQMIGRYQDDGERAIDRPSLLLSGSAGRELTQAWHLNFDFFHKSRRTSGSTFSPTKLPSYTIFGLGTGYQVGRFKFSGKVSNLFDREYEDIFGFRSGGRFARLKMSYQF